MSCFGSFEAMCRRIVSPTRHPHLDEKEILERKYRKRPPHFQVFTVINEDFQRLSCIVFPNDFENFPTIMYLHGNGGHKMQAAQLLNQSFNLIAFDFAACGKSEGQYLTYGEKQVRDIKSVVQQVRKKYKIGKICLWGRSMGASLASMYASSHPKDIFCLILDTPFRSLKEVVTNVAQHNNRNLPSFLLSLILYFIENKVTDLVGKDIFATDFLMYLNLVDVPALFIFSTNDAVVSEANVKQLYQSYRGSKRIIGMQCLHHQDRPLSVIREAMDFIAIEDGNRSTRSSMTSQSKRGISISIRGNTSYSNQ